MALLIDGYNVLYAVGILGGGVGPGTLERARAALLNFLAEALPPEEIPHTTVVFDAAHAPRDLAHAYTHRGLQVRFSVGYENADALLAELIRTESTPRRLTVVSSDRQVQRAARRRRAKAVDAEPWWTETERKRGQRRKQAGQISRPPKRSGPLSEEEVAFWLEEFGGTSTLDWPSSGPHETATGASPPPSATGEPRAAGEPRASEKQADLEELTDLENPFPPGYGEDLLDEDG